MQRIRFRLVLPVVFGFLAFVLFTWQHETNRMIELMGMAWDMGPPMWPYQAVPLFSYAINAPAYIVCWPLTKLIDVPADWPYYMVWLPVIVLLWWWVGTRIDFGLLGRRKYRHPTFTAVLMFVGALVLLILSVNIGVGEYRLFQHYWPAQRAINAAIILLRAIGPILWCLLLARAFIRSAFRLLGRDFQRPPQTV